MNVRGSAINAIVGVYEGDSLETLHLLYWGCYYKIGELHFRARGGMTYRIMVDSYWEGSVGRVLLNLFRPNVPPNDDFVNARVLKGTQASVSGNNRFTTIEAGEGLEPASSQWYSWTAPESGVLTFRYREQLTYTARGYFFHLYTGDALTNLHEVIPPPWNEFHQAVKFVQEALFPVSAGTTYYLQVTSFGYPTRQPADTTFHFSLKLYPN
jgi:hypothetical protein